MSKKYMGKYTKKQIALLVSFVLGDGCITKTREKRANSLFACQHSIKQIEWLKFKRNLMIQYGFKVSKIYDVSNKYGNLIRFTATDVELFNQLRKVWYPKNNKTIKRKWLNYLTPQYLAYWIMDDGSFTYNSKKSGYISLHTNSYNKHENDIIIKYFKQVYDIHPNLRVVKRKNRRQTFFLTFPVKETIKLIHLIQPYIIQSMLYKVGFKGNEQPILG